MHFLPIPTEFGPLLNFVVTYLPLIASLAAVLLVLVELRRLSRERSQEEREQGNLGVERRRLTEVNIRVDHNVKLTEQHPGTTGDYPFLVFFLPLENKGDGPVDIWGSLVSSRVLDSAHKPGIGLRSRDVEWSDYQTFVWNASTAHDMFAGTSTTKNMIATADHFVRLSSKEKGTLRRIDGVNNPTTLQERSPVTIMYRVFIVARGYPLGEILRQLGGGPPEPLRNVNKNQLQFRTLAQATYTRWNAIQQALINLNRLSFRIAAEEEDPLGRLAEPDAWRFFLLSHEQFSDNVIVKALESVTTKIKEVFPDFILPDDFRSHPRFPQLKEDCVGVLKDMLSSWEALKQVIDDCKNYPTSRYEQVTIEGKLPLRKFAHRRRFLFRTPLEYPQDGYSMRIHIDPFYQRQWLKYMEEGYIISRPFARTKRDLTTFFRKSPVKGVSVLDIPEDPRVLEPFVMRTHYFLETISNPKKTAQESATPDRGDATRKRE